MLNALKEKKTIITPLFLLAFTPCLIWFETISRKAGRTVLKRAIQT